MTTLSMNGAISLVPPAWRDRAPQAVIPTPASGPHWRDLVTEECLDQVLEVSGGLALALLPFLGLAWIFAAC